MKKFRNVPALVTLLAGFVIAVFMIIEKFTLMKFLWILVTVMIAFYVAGIVLRVILNKAFKDPEIEDAEEAEDEEDSEGSENSEQVEDSDDSKASIL